MEISGGQFTMEHKKVYWIHLHACDEVGNCGWKLSWPIFCDTTPATTNTLHPHIIPDSTFNTSADGLSYFLVNKNNLRPAWNTFPECYYTQCGDVTAHFDNDWCETSLDPTLSGVPQWPFQNQLACPAYTWETELVGTSFSLYKLTDSGGGADVKEWVVGPVPYTPGSSYGNTLLTAGIRWAGHCT